MSFTESPLAMITENLSIFVRIGVDQLLGFFEKRVITFRLKDFVGTNENSIRYNSRSTESMREFVRFRTEDNDQFQDKYERFPTFGNFPRKLKNS